jgi:hypothetical protein
MANDVVYRDGRGPAQRIADRLRSSSPAQGQRPTDRQGSDAQKETVPNRTITTVYFPGSNVKHGGDNNG